MPNDNEPQTSQTNTQPTDPTLAAPAQPDPTPAPTEASTPPAESFIGGTVESEAGSEVEEGPISEPVTADQLTIPEGLQFEGEAADEFLALINEPPESRADFANSLIEAHTKILQQTADAYAQQWQETQEDWRRQVRELPEFGGANLDRSQAGIAQLLDRYGDAEAAEAFQITGAGNNPAIYRMLARVAKDLNEAAPVGGTPPAGAPKDRASRMYGTTAQE